MAVDKELEGWEGGNRRGLELFVNLMKPIVDILSSKCSQE